MASTTKEVERELLPLVRVYKDGSVERLLPSPYTPPSTENPDPETGVLSKDVTISQNPNISARLYLPNHAPPQKLPVLVYFHGGGFCIQSAFSHFFHRYINLLVSRAQAIAVSVEYRKAPEFPLPAAYHDCWTALRWVIRHKINSADDSNQDLWLLKYGDFDRLFIGGESSGGNIVHNMLMQAGDQSLNGGVKILGAFLSQPYFWGSNAIGSESSVDHDKTFSYLVWKFVYPTAPDGIDNPMVNPVGPGKPSLAKLGCRRLLVCVPEKDELRDRGVWYVNAVKESGFQGEVDLFEVKGEGHAFHLYDPASENGINMIKRLADFLH